MKRIHLYFLLLIPLLAVEASCAANINVTQPSFTPIPTPTPIPHQTIDPVDAEKHSGMEIGNTIVSAIQQYHEVTGNYPSKLSDLVPQYLEKTPVTLTDQEYQYVAYQPGFVNWPYVLYFYGINGKWVCAYHPKYDEWECSSGTTP